MPTFDELRGLGPQRVAALAAVEGLAATLYYQEMGMKFIIPYDELPLENRMRYRRCAGRMISEGAEEMRDSRGQLAL